MDVCVRSKVLRLLLSRTRVEWSFHLITRGIKQNTVPGVGFYLKKAVKFSYHFYVNFQPLCCPLQSTTTNDPGPLPLISKAVRMTAKSMRVTSVLCLVDYLLLLQDKGKTKEKKTLLCRWDSIVKLQEIGNMHECAPSKRTIRGSSNIKVIRN